MTMDEVRILFAAMSLHCFTRDDLVAQSRFDAEAVDAWLHGNRPLLRVPPSHAEHVDFATTWIMIERDRVQDAARLISPEQDLVLAKEHDWNIVLDEMIAQADKFLAIHAMKPKTEVDANASLEAWDWFLDYRKMVVHRFAELDRIGLQVSEQHRSELKRLIDVVPVNHEAAS